MKSWLVFILSLTMILTLKCQTSSAEPINLKPKVCINRADEEKFVVCFEQNILCHEALKKASVEPKSEWELFILAVAGGILTGVFIESREKH